MAGRLGNETLPRWRMLVTYAVMILISGLYITRLFTLQIIEGESYLLSADENRFSEVNVPAPRGVIYDRNGSILVRNIPAYNVYITPALLPDSPAETNLILEAISRSTGVPLDQQGPPAGFCVPGRGLLQLVEEATTNWPFDPYPVACDIGENVARVLREKQVDMPGVSIDAVSVREYTTGNLTAAIIGYMGPIPEIFSNYYEGLGFDKSRDKIGYAGVEAWYQDILAGTNGRKLVESDVAGQHIREYGTIIQPVPGNSLRLTIDARLQAAAEVAITNQMDFLDRFAGEDRTPLGVVIAIDPRNGEILAMVTLPTYQNNRFARAIPGDYYLQLVDDERGKPLINHAISLEQPPGSTFKMVTATGILNEGVVGPQTAIFDAGKITISNRYFPNDPGKSKDFVCWKRDGHGYVAFTEAIAFSCNVYFYKAGGGFPGEIAGDGLGVERLASYAQALGYGHPLGIDLPGEEDGLIPDRDWKRINLGENWSTGDTYNASTGQGFVLATPLQVLNSVATLANGGKVFWPHLLKEVLDGEGNVVNRIQPCILWDISDGVITPLDEIGRNCPSLDDNDRRRIIGDRLTTPDINVGEWVISLARQGMHLVTTIGTAEGYGTLENISSGGKTGTGEFCDKEARERNLCAPGNWPTHAWYVGFAPFNNPEIAVVSFVYNGGEGAVTSGPVVREVLETYFELKAIDALRAP